MKKTMLKLALVTALLATVPMGLANGHRFNQQGSFDNRQVGAVLSAARAGLVAVNVVLSNVNVQALNNVQVNVPLTNVLRNANIITDNQVVVGVNVLGDQTIVSVYELLN
jgi:hypothetical protein